MREFGFLLAWRRRWGALIAAFQYLKGVYKKAGKELFAGLCSDRTTGNDLKLKDGRVGLNIMKKFFTVRVERHWKCFRLGWVGFEQPVLWKLSLPMAGDWNKTVFKVTSKNHPVIL